MKFVVREYRATLQDNAPPTFVLTTDKWDDFGYVCQFHLSYIDPNGREQSVGVLKILQAAAGEKKDIVEPLRRTELPRVFPSLDEHYISLGQTDEYYERLSKIVGMAEAMQVLEALRDIALQPTLATPFEPTSAFRNALMRENGAYRARRIGGALVRGETIDEDFNFQYSGDIPGAENPVETTIPFDPKDQVPGRIVGIIGRNAVGKTQFLSNLAKDLAQIGRTSNERQKEREERFARNRPLFTRVIAVSYSAFDKFVRPKSAAASYVYCGIRSEGGGLTQSHLFDAYKVNQRRIKESARTAEWSQYIRQILRESSEFPILDFTGDEVDLATDGAELSQLSSGQAILIHFATALVAWLQPNSLVLFDEPETHLHPNAVANLFNTLTRVLNAYDSFAIVATHSPIVIQQIPAKRVLVFRRTGNVTVAEPLALESFGESITELTRHVFETNEVQTLYRRTLSNLAVSETIQQTMERFVNGLSLSAQAYLIAQHAKTKDDDGNAESD
jgi:predicted ATPase